MLFTFLLHMFEMFQSKMIRNQGLNFYSIQFHFLLTLFHLYLLNSYIILAKFSLYLFIYFMHLSVSGLSCGTWDLQWQHVNSQLWYVRSNSRTRDQTSGPMHWEHGVLVTGPPAKSLPFIFVLLLPKSLFSISFSSTTICPISLNLGSAIF